jgi:uncharacterized metal-binding protein YceD (DUF177 family)
VAREDIADTGQHFDLAADKDVRTAIGRMAGLRELPRLEASFDVTRVGDDGLRVAGRLSATVGQTCVVTLEPLSNEVEEAIDLVFAALPADEPDRSDSEIRDEMPGKVWSDQPWRKPEPMIGGIVDLGAIATEFLMLGIDSYPRKPGVVFEPPQESSRDEGPFAVLAQLTKGRDGY